MRELVVEHCRLSNGIQALHYPMDAPFVRLKLTIPVGHAHAGAVHPGIFHFLEHMACERSEQSPRRRDFSRFVGLSGGTFTAATSHFYTEYVLTVPTEQFERAALQFFQHVFEPMLHADDIALNRHVLSNERKRESRWFPAHNEISYFKRTKWQLDRMCTLRQLYGTDEDLEHVSRKLLRTAHKAYFDPGITLISAGNANVNVLHKALDTLTVSPHHLAESHTPVQWANREISEYKSSEVSRYQLSVAGIFERLPELSRAQAVRFIVGYLTNPVHGSLFEWLRWESGWVYEIGSYAYVSKRHLDWELSFPCSSREQMDTVRRSLMPRIADALKDRQEIELEANRVANSIGTFEFCDVQKLVDIAQYFLGNFGAVLTSELVNWFLERCRCPEFLEEAWADCTRPDRFGMLCIVPKQGP